MTPTIAQELLEKPGLLVSLQSVVSNFCDIDALLSLCVVIRGDAGSDGASRKRSHEDSIFNLEQRVNHIIGLKHALEVILFSFFGILMNMNVLALSTFEAEIIMTAWQEAGIPFLVPANDTCGVFSVYRQHDRSISSLVVVLRRLCFG